MTHRIRLVRRAPAFPNLMQRIGRLPKLSETEQRALAYSERANNLEADKARAIRRRKRKEPA